MINDQMNNDMSRNTTDDNMSPKGNEFRVMIRTSDNFLPIHSAEKKLHRRSVVIPIELPIDDFRCVYCLNSTAAFVASCGCFVCRTCSNKMSSKKCITPALFSGVCVLCKSQVRYLDMDRLDHPSVKNARSLVERLIDWSSALTSISNKGLVFKQHRMQYNQRLSKSITRHRGGTNVRATSQAQGQKQGRAVGQASTMTDTPRHRMPPDSAMSRRPYKLPPSQSQRIASHHSQNDHPQSRQANDPNHLPSRPALQRIQNIYKSAPNSQNSTSYGPKYQPLQYRPPHHPSTDSRLARPSAYEVVRSVGSHTGIV